MRLTERKPADVFYQIKILPLLSSLLFSSQDFCFLRPARPTRANFPPKIVSGKMTVGNFHKESGGGEGRGGRGVRGKGMGTGERTSVWGRGWGG